MGIVDFILVVGTGFCFARKVEIEDFIDGDTQLFSIHCICKNYEKSIHCTHA